MRIGILALQGCVEPHRAMLKRLEIESVPIRRAEELSTIDRLILPGGESTTMLTLIERSKLWEPLLKFGKNAPLWGICAGAILIAKEVENPKQRSFGLIDIRAQRNHYGSQRESFRAELTIEALAKPALTVDFIRAPLLTPLAKAPNLKILAQHGTDPVLFVQGSVMACSFHSELGTDPRLHEYFAKL